MANLANKNKGRAISKKTLMLAQMGILTAIVVVLQILASGIRFGTFSITLVLIPVIIGAALRGVIAGGWLGLVFGAVVLISGDAAPFMAFSIPGTVITVLVKGALAGVAAGLVYRLIADKNKTAAVIAAGVACPVVNTGIFVVGSYVFFLPLIAEWAGDSDVASFIFIGMIGINFFVELGINMVFAAAIVRLIRFIAGQFNSD